MKGVTEDTVRGTLGAWGEPVGGNIGLEYVEGGRIGLGSSMMAGPPGEVGLNLNVGQTP